MLKLLVCGYKHDFDFPSANIRSEESEQRTRYCLPLRVAVKDRSGSISNCFHSDAERIVKDLQKIVTDLETETRMAPISVEYVDSEMSIVYSNSNKGAVTSVFIRLF